MNKTSDAEASAYAEYTSVRQEIADRIRMRHTLLTLQLTIAGALYSFRARSIKSFEISTHCSIYYLHALSPSCGGILCTREGVLYIQNKLSPRVRGGLGWEAWRKEETIRPGGPSGKLTRAVFGGSPLMISFPVVSAVALIWAIPFTFISKRARQRH